MPPLSTPPSSIFRVSASPRETPPLNHAPQPSIQNSTFGVRRSAFILLFTIHSSLFSHEIPNTEKTPGSPMPAQQAADTLVLPHGFKATVFASEPHVQNPIDFSWDTKGRLWIAENYTYERRRDITLPDTLHDRVLIFHDTDNDGVHNTRKVFTDKIKNLTSLEWAPNGLYLMCPPKLLFIPDKNRDDLPDSPPITLLDGFTEPSANNHNFANGLRWGPDGWLYGRCGASAPGEIGKPGTPPEKRIPLRGGIWRYHPQHKIYETLCHGTTNPWGHDWNADGQLFFVNTVNGHFFHMIPGAHYKRPHTLDPNPYVYDLIGMHADHWHFDTSGSWTKSRNGAANHLGGGHAHVGLCIYQGHNFPEKYHGKAFTLNLHGQRCNVERLERKGSGYVAKHEPDFFISKDPFFRGIDLTVGPDGSMFVLDWSDNGECHENTGVHRTSGRIFKIKYQPAKTDQEPLIDLHDNETLGSLLTGPSIWHSRMASMVLMQQDPYRTLPNFRIGREYRLINRLNPNFSHSAIDTIDGRYDPENTIPKPKIPHVSYMPKEDREARYDTPQLRLFHASLLQRLPHPHRLPLAKKLLSYPQDATDHNIPLMIWYGLIPLGQSHPTQLAELTPHSQIPLVTQYITRRLTEDYHTSPQPLTHLLNLNLTGSQTHKAAILRGFTEATTAWHKAPQPTSWRNFTKSLVQTKDPQIKQHLAQLNILFGDGKALDQVKALALNNKASLANRKAALQSLARAQHPELKTIAFKLLDTRFLNLEAARALVRFDDPDAAKEILSKLNKFHPHDRPHALAALCTHPTHAATLLQYLANGKLPKSALLPIHARAILAHNKPTLTTQLHSSWGTLRDTPAEKQKLIHQLKAQLTPNLLKQADLKNGATLYQTHCATCHKLKGQGGTIGPDLTGSDRSNLDYLLENIIDPSADVSADFLLSTLTLTDGRTLAGTVLRKTETTTTLQTPTEKLDIPTTSIKSRTTTTQSLMPEGLLESLNKEQQRDLLSFLMK